MPTISAGVSTTYTTGSPVSITIASGTLAAAVVAITPGSTSPTLTQLVQVAMALVADAVLQEDASLANQANRHNFARLVINNPVIMSGGAIYTIASDGVTNASSTDQAIVNRILSVWDQLCYGA